MEHVPNEIILISYLEIYIYSTIAKLHNKTTNLYCRATLAGLPESLCTQTILEDPGGVHEGDLNINYKT